MYSFEHGYYTVIKTLVDKIKDRVTILKRKVVTNIDWSLPERAVISCQTGQTFECDMAIVTVSLGYLKEHHLSLFTPDLPCRKVAAIESFCFGTIARIKLDFADIFWDQTNPGIHILWRDELKGFEMSRDTWVRHVVGFDEILNQPTMLMAWVSGQAARFMETLSDVEIGQDLCQLLSRVTGKAIPTLRGINVTRWFSNPYQRGVYSYRYNKHQSLSLSF